MFEFIVLLIGAFPFLVGLYAIKVMRQRDDDETDDPPPPPDPSPPPPIAPSAPRRRQHPPRLYRDRSPVSSPYLSIREAPTRRRTDGSLPASPLRAAQR